MINIVCLKWGTKYGPEYVNRLYYAIRRNTSMSFKFHCFVDNPNNLNKEIIIHPLPNSNLEGWWNKVYLFNRHIDIPIGEKIVFFDLDTLIIDNIDDILNLESEDMITMRDFLTGIISSIKSSDNRMQSCIMIWNHGTFDHVWNRFIENPNLAIKSVEPHGDQRWIESQVPNRKYVQDLLPNRVVSFKVHCRNGFPNDADIICYHGRPSIPESASFTGKIWKFEFTPQSWVLKHWKDDDN